MRDATGVEALAASLATLAVRVHQMVAQQVAYMRVREQSLTHERLMEMLSYDPETGVFRWRRKPARNIIIGQRAGQVRSDAHRAINIDGKRHYEHRLAWLYIHGSWPEHHVDHINLDGTDNRLANLRQASGSDNYGNQGLRRDNTSGVKGVIYNARAGKWIARISRYGRSHCLGTFCTRDAASEAYAEAARNHFGEFARHASHVV